MRKLLPVLALSVSGLIAAQAGTNQSQATALLRTTTTTDVSEPRTKPTPTTTTTAPQPLSDPCEQENEGWGCDPPNVPHNPAFWGRLRNCESSDGRDSANGAYHGFYQFTLSSWRGAGGTGDPHRWDLAEQTWRAKVWASKTNPYGQWPQCWRVAMNGGSR